MKINHDEINTEPVFKGIENGLYIFEYYEKKIARISPVSMGLLEKCIGMTKKIMQGTNKPKENGLRVELQKDFKSVEEAAKG